MIFASKAFFIFLPVVLVVYHLLRRRSHKYTLPARRELALLRLAQPAVPVGHPALHGHRLRRRAADRAARPTTARRRRWLVAQHRREPRPAARVQVHRLRLRQRGVTRASWLRRADAPTGTWDILLPLGISFHTFQGISYTVDVYRRQIRAVRSFRDYALFVAFFPQLAAGPIVRAVEFLPQMATPPRVTAAAGRRRAALLRPRAVQEAVHRRPARPAVRRRRCSPNPAAYDAATHRWAAVAWAVQIYCDFSGYTDMAVGCAKWFGFELPRNFHFPYLATSITDFWRRWHLSLSTWLRDYLYFPLGGSRRGAARTYFNLMVVFVLCGLWHGATWDWLAYGVLQRRADVPAPRVRPGADRRAVGGRACGRARRGRCSPGRRRRYQFLIGLILVRMAELGRRAG